MFFFIVINSNSLIWGLVLFLLPIYRDFWLLHFLYFLEACFLVSFFFNIIFFYFFVLIIYIEKSLPIIFFFFCHRKHIPFRQHISKVLVVLVREPSFSRSKFPMQARLEPGPPAWTSSSTMLKRAQRLSELGHLDS